MPGRGGSCSAFYLLWCLGDKEVLSIRAQLKPVIVWGWGESSYYHSTVWIEIKEQ